MSERFWRVLIADDEQKVCELIRYLVPWEDLHLTLAAVASNGVEAMQVLEREPIDIVITDARMPECDGIELIKWCHQKDLNPKYIVISGYRHFEYAHGALQYGVDFYLLKPINQRELCESLQKLVEALDEETEGQQAILEMQRQHSLDQDKLRRHFINSYIFDGRKLVQRQIESAEEINEEYRMNFAAGIYQAVYIKLDSAENAGYKLEKLTNRISETAELCLKDFCSEQISVPMQSGVVLLLNYPVEQEDEFRPKIEELYRELDHVIDIFDGLRMTFGVSEQAHHIREVNHCILTAADAVRYRIVLPRQDIVFYDNYQFDEIPLEKIFTDERKELLKGYLRGGNENGLKKMLFDMKFLVQQHRNISPLTIYYIVQESAELAMDVLAEETKRSAEDYELFHLFAEKEDRAAREKELWEAEEELLISCMELLEKERRMAQTKPIRMVKEYIEAHYAEGITLEMAADHVGLSVNYVSSIFKKETGVTFSDYLTAKRMEHAVELLRKTDRSIAEIAELVGYSDVKYFSKLCKKTLGMKPSEYRKLYS